MAAKRARRRLRTGAGEVGPKALQTSILWHGIGSLEGLLDPAPKRLMALRVACDT